MVFKNVPYRSSTMILNHGYLEYHFVVNNCFKSSVVIFDYAEILLFDCNSIWFRSDCNCFNYTMCKYINYTNSSITLIGNIGF